MLDIDDFCKFSSIPNSNRKRSTSWTNPIYIPQEILIDILTRLPVKSLIRFRCVCKSWSDLIGSSAFGSTHLAKNVTNHAHSYLIALHRASSLKSQPCYSFFSNQTFEPCFEDLSFKCPFMTKEMFMIYGSSNGLVCMTLGSGRFIKNPMYICNPSIRKFRTLPTNSYEFSHPLCNSLSFGFHPKINDYKVVRMLQFDGHNIKMEVYSLGTNSWKMIDQEAIPPSFEPRHFFRPSVFLNGVVYWLVGKVSEKIIVSFDTSSEEFEELMVSDDISTGSLRGLRVYKESICLIEQDPYQDEKDGTIIDLWVLDLQDKSFKKLHTVVVCGIDPRPLWFRPPGFSTDIELLLEGNNDRRAGEKDVLLYNFKSKQVTRIGIRLAIARINWRHDDDDDPDAQIFGLDSLKVVTYVESLALIND